MDKLHFILMQKDFTFSCSKALCWHSMKAGLTREVCLVHVLGGLAATYLPWAFHEGCASGKLSI